MAEQQDILSKLQKREKELLGNIEQNQPKPVPKITIKSIPKPSSEPVPKLNSKPSPKPYSGPERKIKPEFAEDFDKVHVTNSLIPDSDVTHFSDFIK